MYEFSRKEETILREILHKPYLLESIRLTESFVSKDGEDNKKDNYILAFNEIFTILIEARSYVDDYLTERQKNGEIQNKEQAIKSIAGNSFSQIIIYIFLQNKKYGNIRSDIYITSRKSQVPSFDSITTINIDGETQKPDCDIVIYSLNSDQTLKKCLILSLKTSLRERAGQTYKWKLLMEIATTDNPIKEKYNISHNSDIVPLVCFATVNFYDEINNPQQRGMFKFFDKSFVAKNVDSEFVARLSELPNYVNSVL